MDLDEAIDELEICSAINIEQLVNENKCPTKIVSIFLKLILCRSSKIHLSNSIYYYIHLQTNRRNNVPS